MCVCVEGIFHVEPTSMQDTKRQNLNVFENCIYEDEKKVPTRNFRVHFCAVWMQVDANIQHIRDAAALKKGTGKFLSANFEKRDTKTALEASESE